MTNCRVSGIRKYLFDKFKEECKEQGADVTWTTERAVHFCTELQNLDRDMLESLYERMKEKNSKK